MTIAELITHLSRYRYQDSEILIRIQHHQLGQLDLDIVDFLFEPHAADHGYHVLVHEDPWANEERWPPDEDIDTEGLL